MDLAISNLVARTALAHVAPSTALAVVKVSVASRPGGTLTASLTATT